MLELVTWNNGNRDPGWGVAEIQKMSPPTTVGDAADMQLPCYQTRESPSSGKCSIFCYRLTYISQMCSMHTKNFYWGGIAVIVIGSYLPPEFPFFHGWGLT